MAREEAASPDPSPPHLSTSLPWNSMSESWWDRLVPTIQPWSCSIRTPGELPSGPDVQLGQPRAPPRRLPLKEHLVSHHSQRWSLEDPAQTSRRVLPESQRSLNSGSSPSKMRRAVIPALSNSLNSCEELGKNRRRRVGCWGCR